VYIRKKIGRKRSFIRKYRVLIFFLAASLFAIIATRNSREPIERTTFKVQPDLPHSNKKPPYHTAKRTRLVYPYSIIPGGVLNRAELIEAVEDDTIVAEHYSRFKAGEAKLIRAEETQFMHVSYRIRNKVFWTAKKLKIPKGETLITDGSASARTRCGNMVSAAPQEPVSPEEPPIEVFDVPLLDEVKEAPPVPPVPEFKFEDIPPWDVHVMESYNPPEENPPNPENYLPPVPYYSPPTDIVVPESGTLSLLILGLTALFTLKFSRKDKS
jgi:hypothetical protein